MRGEEFSALEKERMERIHLVLENGGSPSVNGKYSYYGIKQGAAMYERRAPYTTPEGSVIENARYMIYKCEVKTRANQWFISIVKEGSEPGTNADIDLYYALEDKRQSALYGRTLPPQQWQVFERNTAIAPAPKMVATWEDASLDPVNAQVRHSSSSRVTAVGGSYDPTGGNGLSGSSAYGVTNTNTVFNTSPVSWEATDDLYVAESKGSGYFDNYDDQ